MKTYKYAFLFPLLDLLHYLLYSSFKLPEAVTKKKVISLHWAECCRVMKNSRGGKDSQLLFVKSDFDRVRENRYVKGSRTLV